MWKAGGGLGVSPSSSTSINQHSFVLSSNNHHHDHHHRRHPSSQLHQHHQLQHSLYSLPYDSLNYYCAYSQSLAINSFCRDQYQILRGEIINQSFRGCHNLNSQFETSTLTLPQLPQPDCLESGSANIPILRRSLTSSNNYLSSYCENAMIAHHSDDDSPSHGTMPGSPPDLSLTSSKSSKSSSFHSSYQSDDNSILGDTAHFEDIGLDDDANSEREIDDFVQELPKPFTNIYSTDLRSLKRLPPRSKSHSTMQRELTSSQSRHPYPNPRAHSRNVPGEVHGLGVHPSMSRRGLTSSSTPSLANLGRPHRSPSPAHSLNLQTLPTPTSTSSRSRRGSWQSNRERKTIHQLELECDEDDGDDVPDGCFLENVPISPRPPHERAVSMPLQEVRKRRDKEKVKPAGNGTPATPVAHGSLKSPNSPKPPPVGARGMSMGQFPINHNNFNGQPRAKSWTAVLSQLSDEAKALTEALEAHADDQTHLPKQRRSRSSNPELGEQKQRAKSSIAELPPLRRSELMIDPLPISKEKEAVLSRTRPSWLPPKNPLEEKRHLREYQQMMSLSREAERKRQIVEKEKVACKDDTASSLLKIWEQHVLPNWDAAISQKGTRELFWRGVAPRSRGAVWQRAIGNQLGLSDVSYKAALRRAQDLEKKVLKGYGSEEDRINVEWFNAIRRDVRTTYPELKIFQPGGPLYDNLVDVMMAYVVYRSDVGYVEGMSTTTAVLLLNLPNPASTFTTLANLLQRNLPLSFYTVDIGAISRLHSLTLETLRMKFPQLHSHLCASHLDIRFHEQPSIYLDFIYTSLFTESLDLDSVTRLWDVWAFEGDAVLVRAMVALLGCVESKLYGATTKVAVQDILRSNISKGGDDAWMTAVKEAGRI